MPTVRETTYDLLRTWGLTTVFGNPGSNELPFLDGFPADFRYVLGLHEGAVLAMADGYAQATGRPALVNLHSAAGLGALFGHARSVWSPKGPQAPVLLQRVTSGAGTPGVSGCGSRH
ncbi:thiamine pyrophosphate-binding protein [Nonomuraea sp. NPDC049480]|uniref:thiamine pyrophosphate-binding protein n=1 Tax=Nonomuraea sp. NPDC049480 TaxID=3364353 RepID=UPI0037B6B794